MFPDAYTRVLKRYDRDVYAARNSEGIICVFRTAHRQEYVGELKKGVHLFETLKGKQFIFALTDTWTLKGRPRAWGIDIVADRLRSMDALANERLFEELDRHNEKVDESNRRHLKNEMEAFWSHERRRFAKATDDILVHSLSKDEPKKRLRDRRIK